MYMDAPRADKGNIQACKPKSSSKNANEQFPAKADKSVTNLPRLSARKASLMKLAMSSALAYDVDKLF